MATNKVEICGVNTSKLPVLTNEEKETLLIRIKEGDSEARERYIQGNLRLVLSVIKRFSNSSENPDDLFQIGCIGLIKAIDNFDTTPECQIFHLCSSNDHRRDPPLPARTTMQSASAAPCGIPLTRRSACEEAYIAHPSERAHRLRRSPRRSGSGKRRSSMRWTQSRVR